MIFELSCSIIRIRTEDGSIFIRILQRFGLFYWHVKNEKGLEQGWQLGCINSDRVVAVWRTVWGRAGAISGLSGQQCWDLLAMSAGVRVVTSGSARAEDWPPWLLRK